MTTKRAHVLLPEDLLREIDALVGPRGRSAFLVETARSEVRRQKLLQFLESKGSGWKDEDHPELAEELRDLWAAVSIAEDVAVAMSSPADSEVTATFDAPGDANAAATLKAAPAPAPSPSSSITWRNSPAVPPIRSSRRGARRNEIKPGRKCY